MAKAKATAPVEPVAPQEPETTQAPAPTEPVAAEKTAKGLVRVEVIGCISVHGATVQPGTIIEISEDLFKAYGPDYVKKSTKPVTVEVQAGE